jgi:dolichol-phosphate mannosyltransferase
VTTTLNVVVPCYNEMATLADCVARVQAIATDDLAIEIVIVDDASTDESLVIAGALADRHPEINVYSHEVNRGKGAALRTGVSKVTGDFVAVQDADLEYDPTDLVRLLEPLEAGKADVAFGSRYLTTGPHRVLYFWHSVGNQFLTLISNIFTDLNLTDMETCYKVFKREVIQSIEIEED